MDLIRINHYPDINKVFAKRVDIAWEIDITDGVESITIENGKPRIKMQDNYTFPAGFLPAQSA